MAMQTIRAVLAGSLLALLAACGGGGSDADEPAQARPGMARVDACGWHGDRRGRRQRRGAGRGLEGAVQRHHRHREELRRGSGRAAERGLPAGVERLHDHPARARVRRAGAGDAAVRRLAGARRRSAADSQGAAVRQMGGAQRGDARGRHGHARGAGVLDLHGGDPPDDTDHACIRPRRHRRPSPSRSRSAGRGPTSRSPTPSAERAPTASRATAWRRCSWWSTPTATMTRPSAWEAFLHLARGAAGGDGAQLLAARRALDRQHADARGDPAAACDGWRLLRRRDAFRLSVRQGAATPARANCWRTTTWPRRGPSRPPTGAVCPATARTSPLLGDIADVATSVGTPVVSGARAGPGVVSPAAAVEVGDLARQRRHLDPVQARRRACRDRHLLLQQRGRGPGGRTVDHRRGPAPLRRHGQRRTAALLGVCLRRFVQLVRSGAAEVRCRRAAHPSRSRSRRRRRRSP